jgi:aspartate 1-decarboxylase
MLLTLMKGKIHRARVTGADLNYEGSISIDQALIEAAGFLVNERVDI